MCSSVSNFNPFQYISCFTNNHERGLNIKTIETITSLTSWDISVLKQPKLAYLYSRRKLGNGLKFGTSDPEGNDRSHESQQV